MPQAGTLPEMMIAGLDGGGSQITCRIAAVTGEVLGEARAGGASLTHWRPEQVIEHLAQAMQGALHQAQRPQDAGQIAALCAGFASAGDLRRRSQYETMLRKLAPEARIMLVTDAELALAGALDGEPGIVVISGTGSIAMGRNAQNQIARAGGNGPEQGDEGSGYWIGRQAVCRVIGAVQDAKSPTAFHAFILAHWSKRDVHELVNWLQESHRNGIRVAYAGLVPLVAQAAQAGDAEARAILTDAGRELARLAQSVALELQMPAPRVAGCGGVLQHAEAVAAALQTALAGALPQARWTQPAGPPVAGAIRLARQLMMQAE